MGKHLDKNKKIKLAMLAIAGKSYAAISKEHGVPESTVRDICKANFAKCFLWSELDLLHENRRNLKGYRWLYSKVTTRKTAD